MKKEKLNDGDLRLTMLGCFRQTLKESSDYFEEWKDWFWTDFYINFKKSELNELKDTLEQLKKIMILELKEKELDLEMYIVKKN